MPTSELPEDDITAIIRRVESGDEVASTELWEICFPRLLRYCRNTLPDHMRRVLDEEDIALSAFKSFCLGAEKTAFGEIEGRDALWKLLYTIAGRKAKQYRRDQTRQKRGSGKVLGESAFLNVDDSGSAGIDQIPEQTKSPYSVKQFADECESLMDILDDDNLRSTALLRLEGYSIDEIAERTECSKRTVERRLNLIRRIWNSIIGT